jgi:hypothetical protein
VYSLAVFDDGTGPALYAGGYIATAGGVAVNFIARWDGSSWSALSGPSGTGVSSEVKVLAIYDDGAGPALYAGGRFTHAGGVLVNRIARWDGTSWSALAGPGGTGMSESVHALAVWDDGTGPALYAGGGFTTAGWVTVNNIARWDGAAWSALSGPAGTGTNGVVAALAAVGGDGGRPALYAGGWLTAAGGVTVNWVAGWDGTSWSALGGPTGVGTNGEVYALLGLDHGGGPVLYAGGPFTAAGGQPSSHLAAWRCPSEVFAEGFDDGGTAAWSLTVP